MKEKWNTPETLSLNNKLTEEILMTFSLDSLFDLLIEKINEIKLLNKYHTHKELYSEVKQEIMLIQKMIVLKKSENPK